MAYVWFAHAQVASETTVQTFCIRQRGNMFGRLFGEQLATRVEGGRGAVEESGKQRTKTTWQVIVRVVLCSDWCDVVAILFQTRLWLFPLPNLALPRKPRGQAAPRKSCQLFCFKLCSFQFLYRYIKASLSKLLFYREFFYSVVIQIQVHICS